MINRLLGNDFAARLISIFLAFMIWMLAFSETNPISAPVFATDSSNTFHNIPINVLNAPELMSVVLSQSVMQSVTLFGAQTALNLVAPSDIRATVDLSHLGDSEGEFVVDVLIERPGPLLVSGRNPTQITISLYELISREKPISFLYYGVTAEGFYLAPTQFSEPSIVTISGARPIVESVVAVVADVFLDENNSSFSQEVTLYMRNLEGETVDGEGVEVTPDTVRIFQEIEQFAFLPIRYSDITLPEGWEIIDVYIYPPELQTLAVVEHLREIEYLTLPEIDILNADLEMLRSWGIRDDDPLSLFLMGEYDSFGEFEIEYSFRLFVELPLPLGIRWAASIPGTPVILDLRIDLLINAGNHFVETNEVENDDYDNNLR
jgi:YbbR domain-containing protein